MDGSLKSRTGYGPKDIGSDLCSTQYLATVAGIIKNLQWSVKPISELVVITA